MDNLYQLKEEKDAVHDPNGGVQSITVEEVNAYEGHKIDKLGRYTGLPFIARRAFETEDVVSPGTVYWNGNALNKSENFVLIFGQVTQDGYSFKRIIEKTAANDMLKIKDFAGRTTTLNIVSYEELNDGEGNPYQAVTVVGFPENSDYVYSVDDAVPCMVEIITKSATVSPLTDYDEKFTAAGGAETFEVETNMKNISVTLNEGKVLQKTEGHWEYSGNELTVNYELAEGDFVYIKGLY